MDAIQQLSEIGRSRTALSGQIDFHFGEALSDAYYAIFVDGISTDDAEELLRACRKKVMNQRLVPAPETKGDRK